MAVNLTGIAADSPIPRRVREFRPAQGQSRGQISTRNVILVGNKLSAGSETVETLGDYVADLSDVYARFGRRSELAWMYRAYIRVDPTAQIRLVAVEYGTSATPSTCNFTFATTATGPGAVIISTLGRQIQVAVSSGDTASVIASNVVARINQDPDLPYSAAVNGSISAQVDITTSQLGPRSKYWLIPLRMSFSTNVATTVTKSSVTAGSVADDVTNAILAVDAGTHTYHVLAATAVASVTSTDGGVGQYSAYITSSLLPANGKDQMMFLAVDGSSSAATAVATSSVLNSVWAKVFRVKNNDWTPGMVAAHCAAAHRLQESGYAAYNFAGYTNSSAKNTVFEIPDPFAKTDRPTVTEQTTDLNNGVSTIGFRTDGTPYIVRSITSYSWVGSTATKDYRAREGHIPSVLFQLWDDFAAISSVEDQPNVANDPPARVNPIPGFTYPSAVRQRANALIRDMCGSYQNNMALLDPSAVDAMTRATDVQLSTAGYTISVSIVPVRHNLFQQTLINQSGDGY